LISALYEVLTSCNKSATKVIDVKVDVTVNQAFSVNDIKVNSLKNLASDFYKRRRRYFKGSLFQESNDSRVDEAFYKTLQHKFDLLITPCQSFPMRDGDCRLPSLSRAEATSLIKSLNNSRCVDIFGINTYDLKCIADDLAPFIVQIFNEILVKEDFPSILPKNNRVFGLLKAKGSREDATKYRPIFVSLWLSKILQKGFLSRFQKLGLTIHPAQQAYQNSKSTSTALLNLRNTLQSHQFMIFC